ncbi:MAG: hypothetical protein RR800_00385 [Comamonas sp.]
MSRRYGRNQKRAHREQIKALHQVKECLTGSIQKSQHELGQANAAIEHAIRVLGEYSIALPPRIIPAGDGWRPGMPLQVADPFELNDFALDSINDMSPTVKFHVLHSLLASVHTEDWSDAIHAEISLYGQVVSYGIDKTGIDRLSTRALEDTLSGAIAPKLARAMAKAIKRPPLYVE